MNKRIEELQNHLGNISKSDVPDLVFIEMVPDGYQVIEVYTKRNVKAEIIKGGKRKQYITNEPLEAILSHYEGNTTVFVGDVRE